MRRLRAWRTCSRDAAHTHTQRCAAASRAGPRALQVLADYIPLLGTILEILAPLALIGLTYLLPVVLWYVVALEGHIGMNTFNASLFFKLTLFMIVQTFFVSAIAGPCNPTNPKL